MTTTLAVLKIKSDHDANDEDSVNNAVMIIANRNRALAMHQVPGWPFYTCLPIDSPSTTVQ